MAQEEEYQIPIFLINGQLDSGKTRFIQDTIAMGQFAEAKNKLLIVCEEGEEELILPERLSVQSELANWFGKDFNKLNISFISNLGTNAAIMVSAGLGYSISIRGAGRYWRNNVLVQKELSPGISSNTVIAWRRNIPTSIVMEKFIKEIQSYTSK